MFVYILHVGEIILSMNDFDTEFMNVSFLPYSVLLKQVLVCIWLGVTVTIWEEC